VSLVSLALVIHVLAATFWAGSTFALARTQSKSAADLFGPQMGAAIVAVAAGAFLWARLFGSSPHVFLGIGAIAAVVAAIVQAVLVGRVRRTLDNDVAARKRATLAHRIASGLLVVTIVSMVMP
jgi:hypothetical protein